MTSNDIDEQVLLGTIEEFDVQTEWPGAPERAVLNYCADSDTYPYGREDATSDLERLVDAGKVERFVDRCEVADDEEVTKLQVVDDE